MAALGDIGASTDILSKGTPVAAAAPPLDGAGVEGWLSALHAEAKETNRLLSEILLHLLQR